ncbi:unnamed protein product, partial [Polarella glacialis]
MLATVHQPLRHSDALSVLAAHLGKLDAQLQEELAYCGILTIRLEQEAEVWLGIDQEVRPCKSSSSLKVLVVLEPPDVKRISTRGFDLVLSWHEEHLASLRHSELFVAATPWLIPAEWQQFSGDAKQPGLGFLRGSKRRAAGHILRHEVWE